MVAKPKTPVRLVLFDVFDTLCTPRLPVHEQYAIEAHKAGIKSVTPQSVRAGFKPAFKDMNATYPMYGKHSKPPLTPEEWWTILINRCMLHGGATEDELAKNGDRMAKGLLARFESTEGYKDFPETLDTLKGLRDLGVKTSVVSNADPRIIITLDELGISPLLSYPPTLSWDIEASKPDPKIFEAACKTCGEKPGDGVIMVGDELVADYRGATGAGLEARLIRRAGEWSDGAMRNADEDLASVDVITSLTEVLEEARRRNTE